MLCSGGHLEFPIYQKIPTSCKEHSYHDSHVIILSPAIEIGLLMMVELLTYHCVNFLLTF